MKRLYLQHMILSGTLILTLGACAHKSPKLTKTEAPIDVASPLPQQTILLQEARSVAENMRAELASLKILMAKQAGELRSLREQSQTVHHREQDQGLELQNIRSQLLSSQAERDQLRKHNMELEGQVASMPDTSQLVSDIQGLRGSFQQIMNNLKGLASDIRLIKQEMRITAKKLKPQQTKISKNLSTAAIAKQLTPDATGRVVIQEGDTLWELARNYNVSVDQLREWNNISSDLIMTGLRLKVTEPRNTIETQTDHVKTSAPLTTSSIIEKSLDIPVQEMPNRTQESRVGMTSEPAHILSIASPNEDAHGSP